MPGLIRLADQRWAAGAKMMNIRALRIIHKWLVVRDVVPGVNNRVVSSESRVMLAADRAALSVHPGRSESALEPAPRNALRVQQVANILAGHGDLVHSLKLRIRSDAIIQQWARIANHGSGRGAVRDIATRRCGLSIGPEWSKCSGKGISRNQI